MGKVRYFYNPDTCDYEQIKPSVKRKVFVLFSYALAAIVIAFAAVQVYNSYYPSVKEVELRSEQDNLKMQWRLLEDEITQLNGLVEKFWVGDEELRRILELDSLPLGIRSAGIGGSPSFNEETSRYFENKIKEAYDRISKIKAKMQVQNSSFDTLLLHANERELFWAAMPAIQPVENKNLRRISTVYGMRINPVLKKWMPHRGFDFMGNTGVPIVATGDGTVELSQKTYGGFGNLVVINHGYGYKTRYAHLDTFTKSKGEKVKRGEVIGFMGNTGRSAGVHLHYEVLKNNVQVNPIGFFEMELDEKALADLLERARKNTVHLD